MKYQFIDFIISPQKPVRTATAVFPVWMSPLIILPAFGLNAKKVRNFGVTCPTVYS